MSDSSLPGAEVSCRAGAASGDVERGGVLLRGYTGGRDEVTARFFNHRDVRDLGSLHAR